MLCPQDALFFLKDFFSKMAAGINPYLPVDLAAEGKPERMKSLNFFFFFFLSFPSYAYVYKLHSVFIW